MSEVRRILRSGVRFAIVDRLPLDEIGEEAAIGVYWLLASMVARPVAQSLDGRLIYDVLDTGRQALPGSGVGPTRPISTLIPHRQFLQRDAAGIRRVALPAHRQTGGHSRVASFHTLHNILRERHPEVLPRLYRPFWFDRQREFHAGEPEVFAAPVFTDGGELRARFSAHQIRGGYALRGEPSTTKEPPRSLP